MHNVPHEEEKTAKMQTPVKIIKVRSDSVYCVTEA